MDNLTIGFLGLGAGFILLLCRVQIGVALGLVSFIGIGVLLNMRAAWGMLTAVPFNFVGDWNLTAIPMFLLMGFVCYHAGLTRGLFEACRSWMARLPGGLAIASVIGSAGFAAVTGSSVACAAAMGRIAVPEMLRAGYDKGLATGSIAAAGTLGALIPPSIAFVIYGWFTEQSVGMLLMAGLIPGLLTAGLYTVMIVGRCVIDPSLAPKVAMKVTWRKKLEALLQVWPMPVLVLGVIGSIYSGMATPTEAGALGAAFALIIGAFMGNLNKKTLGDSVRDALRTTSSLFFLAIGAVMLTRFLAMAGIPGFIADLVSHLELGPISLVIALSIVYLILGMFLDPLGILLITIPVFLPMFQALNLDLVWLGVIMVKYIEIGLLTPPVGFNVYILLPTGWTITPDNGATQQTEGTLVNTALQGFFLAISRSTPASPPAPTGTVRNRLLGSQFTGNPTVFQDGLFLTLQVDIPAGAASGTFPITLEALVMTEQSSGNNLETTVVAGSVTIP